MGAISCRSPDSLSISSQSASEKYTPCITLKPDRNLLRRIPFRRGAGTSDPDRLPLPCRRVDIERSPSSSLTASALMAKDYVAG